MATIAELAPLSAYQRLTDFAERALPSSFLLLVQRLGIAAVFFQSGRTKVEGIFTIPDTTIELFKDWSYLCKHEQVAGIGPLKLGHVAFFTPDIGRVRISDLHFRTARFKPAVGEQVDIPLHRR